MRNFGGNRCLWRDLLKPAKQKGVRKHIQLTYFELKEDSRPQSQKCADRRYSDPLLFKI